MLSTTIIEVDPNHADEGYDEDWTHKTTESLSSSIYNYRYENGRRYHAFREGEYPLPNDEKEQDRLDLVHHIGLLSSPGSSGLHHAPIGPNPQTILDIGTGTGIWAIDIGELYPSAAVIGTDLSPIQPSWVPPNVEFQVDDAEQPWTWRDEFDYIHIRCMNGSIKDWPALFAQAYKHLKPRGWIEVDEYAIDIFSDDGTINAGSAMRRWYDLFAEGITRFGKNADVAKMGEMLDRAGFENREDALFKVPVGAWPKNKKQKELGAYFLLQAESGFEAYGLALFTRVLGMSAEEAGEVVKRAEVESRSRRIHAYAKRFVYWAQKPEGWDARRGIGRANKGNDDRR